MIEQKWSLTGCIAFGIMLTVCITAPWWMTALASALGVI